MDIKIIEPIGYCGGVINAINILKKARLENKDKNIFLYGTLIHNENIVTLFDELEIKQIKFDDFDAFNKLNGDDIVVFSAHGHDKKIEKILKDKNINFYDATCPIVKKNYDFIETHMDKKILFVGNKNHEETKTALSYPNVTLEKDSKFDYILNQTSINKDLYDQVTANLTKPKINGLCPNISKRIDNISRIPTNTDLVIVVGSTTSSNSNYLFNKTSSMFPNTKFINSELELPSLNNINSVAILSGCSTDVELVNKIINKLKKDPLK